MSTADLKKLASISIHAPTRGATQLYREDFERAIISIHAPTRGATSYYFLLLLPILFQSTLPREERPQPPNIANTTIRFQSTLPREERPIDIKFYVPKIDFNPRSHERSDGSQRITRAASNISIHAPTRGATAHQGVDVAEVGDFNPRSHERSDGIPSQEMITGLTFQSTLPREERRDATLLHIPIFYFNPRSHERSDNPVHTERDQHHDFNPRSHERSDTIDVGPVNASEDFNPRSHERSDDIFGDAGISGAISIHAPTRGATAILHKKFVYFYTIPTINI